MHQLWAIRQKERQLNEKLASLRLTREMMEQHLQLDSFMKRVIQNNQIPNGYTNGYHEESDGGTHLYLFYALGQLRFYRKNFCGILKRWFYRKNFGGILKRWFFRKNQIYRRNFFFCGKLKYVFTAKKFFEVKK